MTIQDRERSAGTSDILHIRMKLTQNLDSVQLALRNQGFSKEDNPRQIGFKVEVCLDPSLS